MLIVGAGGLAAQMIDDLIRVYNESLIFWSESFSKYNFINNNFPIISGNSDIINCFHNQPEFIIAVANPLVREKLLDKFLKLGGKVTSFISPTANISKYSSILYGTVILQGALIEAGVLVKENCLINTRAIITHGSKIGAFCEIGPNVIISGDTEIGDKSSVGAGSVILPGIKVGSNVVIAAGAVVIRDIPADVMVAGVPALVKNKRTK